MQKRRINISAECKSSFVAAELAAIAEHLPLPLALVGVGTPASVLGLAVVEVEQVFHKMLPLPRHVREQCRFWQHILGSDLHGQAYVFRIIQSIAIEPEPLQQHGTNKFRGFVVSLEVGQGERLHESLQGQIRWLPEQVPHVALRLPLQYACLCIAATASGWTSCFLPHTPSLDRGVGGSSSFEINFKNLGLKQCDLPRLPGINFLEFNGHEAVLDQFAVEEILEQLKCRAQDVAARDDFDEVDYRSLQHQCWVLQ